MLSYDCQIRVWYKHTDQMAICHHSNYICYYEAARSELLRWLGMSFAEVEKRGIMMPILEVQSKYHRPAYYDELLTVRIMLKELPTARINFFYEIYNEKGDLLNTGMTQLGFIHSDTRRRAASPTGSCSWSPTSGRKSRSGSDTSDDSRYGKAPERRNGGNSNRTILRNTAYERTAPIGMRSFFRNATPAIFDQRNRTLDKVGQILPLSSRWSAAQGR